MERRSGRASTSSTVPAAEVEVATDSALLGGKRSTLAAFAGASAAL